MIRVNKSVLYVGQNFGTSVLIRVIDLATGIVIARILGPQGKGEIVSALFWPTLLVWIGGMGLGYGNVYHVAKDRSNAPQIITHSIISALFLGTLTVVCAQLFVPLVIGNKDIIPLVRIALVFIPVMMVSDYSFAVLQGLERFSHFNAMRLINRLLYALPVILSAIVGRLTVQVAVFAGIGSGVFSAIIILPVLRKVTHFTLKLDLTLWKSSAKFGIKAHLGMVTSFANLRADQGLLIALAWSAQIGYYALAVNLSELIWQLTQAVGYVIFPSTAKLEAGRAEYRIIEFFRFSLPLLGVSALILFIVSPWAVVALYGEQFSPSILPLRILLVGSVCYGLATILAHGFNGLGLPLYGTYSQLLSLVVNVPLLVVLLPKYGIIGAAIASAVSYLVNFILLFYLFLKTVKKPMREIICIRSSDISKLAHQE